MSRSGTSPPHPLTTSAATATRDVSASGWNALLRGTGLAGVLHATGIVAMLANNVLLARCMGQDGFGSYVVLINVATILGVMIAAGMPLAILRLAPQYVSTGQPELARAYTEKFYGWIAKLAIAFGTLASSAILVTWMLGFTSRPLTLCLMIGLGMLMAGCNYQFELARALKKLPLAFLPQKVAWPTTTAIVAGLALATQTQLGLLEAMFATVASLSLLFVLQWRRLRQAIADVSPVSASAPDSVWRTLAAPLWGISLGTALLTTADTLALSVVTDEQTVAIYFAAKRISLLTVLIHFAVSAYAAPRLAGLFHSGDLRCLQNLLTQCAIVTSSTGAACSLLLFAAQEPLMQLFGDDYVVAPACFIGLLLAQVVACTNGCVGSLLTVAGMQWGTAAVHLGTGMLEAIVVAVAAMQYGAVGAAWAVVGTAVLRNSIYLAMSIRWLGVDPSIASVFRKRNDS